MTQHIERCGGRGEFAFSRVQLWGSRSGFGFSRVVHLSPCADILEEIDGSIGIATAFSDKRGRKRSLDRLVFDQYAVMFFEGGSNRVKDHAHGFRCRFGDVDGLKAAFHRRIGPKHLFGFGCSGCANTRNVTAREDGLEEIGSVDAAAFSRNDEQVYLVDEYNGAIAFRLVNEILHAFFQIAAELSAGEKTADFEFNDTAVSKNRGCALFEQALRQTFDQRGFSDAGFAEKQWIALRATTEHAQNVVQFFVATDDAIQSAHARQFAQVADKCGDTAHEQLSLGSK